MLTHHAPRQPPRRRTLICPNHMDDSRYHVVRHSVESRWRPSGVRSLCGAKKVFSHSLSPLCCVVDGVLHQRGALSSGSERRALRLALCMSVSLCPSPVGQSLCSRRGQRSGVRGVKIVSGTPTGVSRCTGRTAAA